MVKPLRTQTDWVAGAAFGFTKDEERWMYYSMVAK